MKLLCLTFNERKLSSHIIILCKLILLNFCRRFSMVPENGCQAMEGALIQIKKHVYKVNNMYKFGIRYKPTLFRKFLSV